MSVAPALIGRYVVERELGTGGMGEVYLAYSPAGDPVAIKLIRSARLDPDTRRRFEREAEIARTIVGTNRIARFLDADPYAERPWLAMEFVQGVTLAAHVTDHAVLPVPLVASLGALLAEGLAAVHAVRLVHRDLKPQNVMLGENGPMLIDFGLGAFMDAASSSLSHSGLVLGTPSCMSPEQADGQPRVTPAADVYGLGAVLVYAATGHCPYPYGPWRIVVAQVSNPNHEPNLDGLPDALQPMIKSMLAHDPADRPSLDSVTQQCAELMADWRLTAAAARNKLIDRTVRGTFEPLEPPSSVDAVPDDGEENALGSSEYAEPESVPERPGRLPASKRVAEELRAQYQAQPSL